MITVKGESGVEGENKVALRALASRAKKVVFSRFLLPRDTGRGGTTKGSFQH